MSEFYERLLADNPALANQIVPRWSDFIPHDPTPKQLAFLMLPHREAFYGGAAGGGKSDALLMAALQYIDVPGYHAILFRKTLTDLELSGSLIDRSHWWLQNTPAKWNGSTHCWTFPSGATLQFGYLNTEFDHFRYASAEFQFIGFDELTQLREDDYLFLFSRLRRSRCPLHTEAFNPKCPHCQEYGYLQDVPLRVRSASNPGGLGHLWVRNRFQIKQVTHEDKIIYRGTDPERPHIPAFISDNPYLEQEEYKKSLSNLDPITREQLLRGDWGVSADGRFRRAWVRYYSTTPDLLILGQNQHGESFYLNRCRCFITVDPAASAKRGPGDSQIFLRRYPSWTVCSTWILTPKGDLCWWDIRRVQVEIPDIFPILKELYQKFKPEFIGIEANGLNIGVFQVANRLGLPVRPLQPRAQDKLVRATDAANRMEQGKIYLPQFAPWKDDLEAELFTWTGHPDLADDQIDTLSYAAMIVSEECSQPGAIHSYSDLPSAW